MENEKWGIGSKKDAEAFAKVMVGTRSFDLIHGEYPHSRQDNTTYARNGDFITGFSGHRMPFKIEIEEYNYVKDSFVSGDEIRKGCLGKLFVNGVQIFECGHRNYERTYMGIQRFIDDMEMNWSWYPQNIEEKINHVVGYREQLFKIKRFVVGQGCMILETIDGKSRKSFLWEDEEDFDEDEPTSLKVEITSPHLDWYPKKQS